MMPTTDYQKMEQAQVLLREAGVIWMFWTSEDIAAMIRDKLSTVGLAFDVAEVMEHMHLTHLSNDDTEESIWLCIENAIGEVAENKLGR